MGAARNRAGSEPAAAPVPQPGAIGEPGYSPLVQVIFRGKTVVLNAPQIANATGRADKIVALTPRTVSYRETDGCYDNESVHYASFDASNPVAAAIEDATYAPDLDAAPSPVQPGGVDDGLQVVHPVVEREPPDVPVRQPAASLVVPDQAEPARQLGQPVPPHRALPVVGEVAQPVGGLHQRRARAADRVGQPGAVTGRREPDPAPAEPARGWRPDRAAPLRPPAR